MSICKSWFFNYDQIWVCDSRSIVSMILSTEYVKRLKLGLRLCLPLLLDKHKDAPIVVKEEDMNYKLYLIKLSINIYKKVLSSFPIYEIFKKCISWLVFLLNVYRSMLLSSIKIKICFNLRSLEENIAIIMCKLE